MLLLGSQGCQSTGKQCTGCAESGHLLALLLELLHRSGWEIIFQLSHLLFG